MFTPGAFSIEDRGEILAVLTGVAFGHLITHSVTVGQAGAVPDLQATALPFLVDDTLTVVRAHVARANPHWKSIDGATGLMIVPGLDGYISPNWYPSKAEHHRVVPTWNYEVVHLHGTVQIHDEPEWKRQLVSDLTDEHEERTERPAGVEAWQVSDAPSEFIDGQLRAIVGVELHIATIEAKRKLSQNRPEADRLGAIDGLRSSTASLDNLLADAMDRPAVEDIDP